MARIDREQWEDFITRGRKAQAAVNEILKPTRPRKYGNVPTFVLADLRLCDADNGPLPAGAHRFASRREAERFVELSLQQRDGRITNLSIQPRFSLHAIGPDGVRQEIGSWIGDFRYMRDGRAVIEDSKGV